VLLVGGWLLEFWDRVVGSDPGLSRLRMAGSGAIAMSTALCVEFGLAVLMAAGVTNTLVSMLLGAVVALMGSMALTGTGVWAKARTAVFFPVAIGVGMVPGVAVAGNTDLMLGVFVVVMFAAVYIRRFGVPFFFYGFMGWMGYFFASFLHASWAMLPQLMLAAVVGAAWVLLLSVTVLRTNPRRTLTRTVRAFDARARAVARACADLLESAGGDPRRTDRARRRVGHQDARLAEVALMVEGWSAEPGALAPEVSGAALRRRLLDAQQLLDRMADAADALAGDDPQLAASAAVAADRLARHNDTGAHRAAQALAETATDRHHDPDHGDAGNGWWPARQFAVAVLEFVAMTRTPAERAVTTGEAAAEAVDEFAPDFQPVVELAMGYLPGSPAVARDVPARGRSWNPLARLDLTSRQAIQVGIAGGLAILAGRDLSAARYYWAVIAAFIMFAGTATRSETFLKGFHRVVGTLVGLLAAVWLAEATAGHIALVLLVIVASMFFGLYFIRVSYAYMIFFLTIMLGQLYSVLHEFSPGLLVLRLEETAIGAGIASLVALLVTPLSTRDTVRSARDNLLHTLAELLTTAADRLDPAAATRTDTGDGTDEPESAGPPDLPGSARAVDDRLRQLALVAKPLTRPLVWGVSPLRTRHRLTLYAATATHARALAVAVAAHGDRPEIAPASAVACHRLAEAATALTDTAPGRTQPGAAEPLDEAETALFAHTHTRPGAQATDPILRPLIHLSHVLRELATGADQAPSTPVPALATGTATADGDRGEPSAPVTTLVGRITTGDGGAVAAGTVLLLSPRGTAIARTRTATDGHYRIDDLPLGTHLLLATAPGHQPTIGYVTAATGQPRRYDLTLTPTEQPGGVTGAVRARDGRPLRDAGLTVVDHTGRVCGHTRTGVDGRYRIDLPPGEYTLVATGYPPTTRHVRLTAGGDHALNLTLSPPETPR
jgi:uncharacterized membrane protein YccC